MTPPSEQRGLWLAAGLLGAIGLISRLAPLADAGGRLFRQFPSEDGYLMLTMSRNIALGHGMSIAEGTIPTNGTQPLATYAYAAGFWVAGGDREAGVAIALILQAVFATMAAYLVYRLGRRLWPGPGGAGLAALTAGLWYAGPISLRHSMNALETGLYALCVVAVCLAVTAERPVSSRPAWARWAGIGALLGVSFWARNDAVLLCGAVGVSHLAGLLPGSSPRPWNRFLELSTAALATAAVASPWLVSNWVHFGNVVPVSGQAQSFSAAFAGNLSRVPTKLFEHFAQVLPLPSTLEEHPFVVAACALWMVGVGVAVVAAARRGSPVLRGLVAVGGIYTVALCLFYGLYFGAGHFMSRYLFPTSPLLALALMGLASAALKRLPPALLRPTGVALLVAVLLTVAGLHWRTYRMGTEHPHFQVVEWVEQNVADDVWVGAIQTGTLGFFHDRTINLDGKVNPAALEARRANRIPEYVADGPIQYLVDWEGIAGWIEKPPLDRSFEILLVDPDRNLAVLGRRERPLGG